MVLDAALYLNRVVEAICEFHVGRAVGEGGAERAVYGVVFLDGGCVDPALGFGGSF